MFPATTWADKNYGWDPWGVRGPAAQQDPRFKESPYYPKYPNNDGSEIAGYDFVLNTACYVPLYNDKTFFYDAESGSGNFFSFPLYQRVQINGTGGRSDYFSVVYNQDGLVNVACTADSLHFVPGPNNVGSHTINLVLLGQEHNKSGTNYWWGNYSSFKIVVEAGPTWINTADLGSLCRGDNNVYDLTTYVDHPAGVTFTLDGLPISSSLNVANLSLGQHNLMLYKTYNNGLYTKLMQITVAQPPPAMGTITTSDACPIYQLGNGGTIQIDGITGVTNNYSFVLVPGDAKPPCSPKKPGDCSSVDTSGDFSGSSLRIPNVPQGSYQVIIANTGTSGACFTSRPVNIVASAPITLSDSTHTDISCAGGADGSITLHTNGGLASTVVYQLSRTGGGGLVTQPTGVFTGLSAGSYTVNVLDGCNSSTTTPDVRGIFTLTQPTQVVGSFSQTDATCLSPGNGSIVVTVSQGSGNYNYSLTLNGNSVASQINSNSPSWEADNLLPGLYTLQVLDAVRPGCPGYSATVTIAGPPALTLTILQKTDLTCYGISTGSISLQGGGGTGAFHYTITNTSTGEVFTNNTGSFINLSAGAYTAILQSAVSGCQDEYTYPQPIMVSQPADISILPNHTDVSCYGLRNGTITVNLSGGTGTLSPVWEIQAGGVWNTLATQPDAGSGADLSALSPGLYRLVVTDGNSCNKTSPVVTIAQPDTLVIPAVTMTDIVCYGGSGTITPSATGGNSGNVFSVSADGAGYTSFVSGAAFPPGSYQVMVTDQKGCVAGYAGTQVITAPSSPLDLSDQLSDYHGYNISCYGATSGIITAEASGGNGSNYSGYKYSADGGSWLSSPVLNGFAAGSHAIRVQDGRGCIVQRTETLIQPASEMTETLLNKKDNDCVDGLAGLLTVSVAGGTAPYQFSRDGNNYQDNGEFTELASGTYNITAMDINGCRLGADYAVVSLYPALVINHTVDAVQCNGGSDGSILLDVRGGFGGYTYQWNPAGSGNQATGLTAGTYIVHITDEKGCGIRDTALVSQPTAVAAQLVIRPLCSDATGGRVRIVAGGGSPPYQYSVDGGKNYQLDSSFTDLPAGGYTVGVIDSHGCTWNQSITITTQPLIPLVNFLVATQQNVLDTLQVEDISSPKPDSVQWSFDTATLLLGNSSLGPLIRYAKPGTYPASMRAYYTGCDFSISQNILIQPYDTNSISPMVLAGLSIDTATLAPNPNAGTFNLYVKLYKAQRLVLTVMSLAGQPVFRKQWDGQQIISEQINLPSNIVSGAYIAELVTETDIKDYNIIVTK